jgi:hypothetical protein
MSGFLKIFKEMGSTHPSSGPGPSRTKGVTKAFKELFTTGSTKSTPVLLPQTQVKTVRSFFGSGGSKKMKRKIKKSLHKSKTYKTYKTYKKNKNISKRK